METAYPAPNSNDSNDSCLCFDTYQALPTTEEKDTAYRQLGQRKIYWKVRKYSEQVIQICNKNSETNIWTISF